MKRETIRRVVMFVLCGAFLLMAACSGNTVQKSEAQETSAESVVTFALHGDVVSLDPAFAYDFSSNPVVNQISEGLLKFDSNSQLVPCLAESWDNPDPFTYIYHIRKNVKFHDNSPMTAEDVIFSLNRIRDQETAAYSGFMFANVESIEKIDDFTVKVTLSSPDALFKYTVATTAGHVISKKYFESNKETFGKPEGGTMGTGPFKYVTWKTGNEVVLEKNDNYWDKSGGPYIDKVVYKIIPEGATQVAGLKSGQITATIGLQVDLLPVVEKLDNINITKADSFSFVNLAFNTQKAPFNDVEVRKALSYAFDKQQFIAQIVKDSGSMAKTTPIGESMWVFAKDRWTAFDAQVVDYTGNMDLAKQHLAKSSVPNGFSAVITTDGDGVRLNAALALQAAAKELGIDLEIEKVSGEELTTMLMSGERDYDIITGNFGCDFPDPSGNLIPIFHTNSTMDGGSNFSNYSNERVDALLDQQAALIDDDKRAELMIDALQIISEDVPCIMLEFYKNIMVTSNQIEGYEITPLWYWDSFMKDIKFK